MKKAKVIFYKIIFTLCLLSITGSAIVSIIYSFKNYTKTELELFIEFPYPSIICIVAFIIYSIVYAKYEKDKLKAKKEYYDNTTMEERLNDFFKDRRHNDDK